MNTLSHRAAELQGDNVALLFDVGEEQGLPVGQYDLTGPALREITERYLDCNDDLPNKRFVGVVAQHGEPLADAARTLEREVFEHTFPDNDSSFMQHTYGPYESDSKFLVVLDREEKRPAGMMRIVDGPMATKLSLPDAAKNIGHTEQDIEQYHNIDTEDRTWDVATLAISPEYRGKILSSVAVNGILYRMFFRLGMQLDVRHVLAIIDSKARRSIDAMGIPFQPLAGHDKPFGYYGSPSSYALYGHFPDFKESVTSKYSNRPKIYEVFRHGIKKFLRQRAIAEVAGMAALGNHVDDNIKLPAALSRPPNPEHPVSDSLGFETGGVSRRAHAQC